jgi:hypothetical protein
MKVKFSRVDEFLEELRLEANEGNVADSIVRLTCRYQQAKDFPHLQHVSVIAGVLVRGKLVELQKFCGIVADFPNDPESEKTRDRAQAAITQIQQAAQELTLSVRKGVFE